jgi:hypothetical protein
MVYWYSPSSVWVMLTGSLLATTKSLPSSLRFITAIVDYLQLTEEGTLKEVSSCPVIGLFVVLQ